MPFSALDRDRDSWKGDCSGSPGRGAVHVVEAVPALGRDSVTVVNGVSVRSRHAS